MSEFVHDEEGYCGITFEDLAELCPNLHGADLDLHTTSQSTNIPPRYLLPPPNSTPFLLNLHRIALKCLGNFNPRDNFNPRELANSRDNFNPKDNSNSRENYNLRGRRLFWLHLLGVHSGSTFKEFADQIISSRNEYWQKVKKFDRKNSIQIQQLDPQIFHPLAPAETNPWSLSQKSKELMAEIWQDIQRTYQERALFQRDSVRKSLQRILFVWSMEHHYISYKQGMNELLAIIYITCYRDQYNPLHSVDTLNSVKNVDSVNSVHSVEEEENELEDLCKKVFSGVEEDVESDSYVLFNALMCKELQMLYDANAVDYFYTSPGKLNPLINRCNHIYNLLKECDNKLYMHLKSLDLEPHLFLMRWIRLLFSREFNVNETLNLWDFLLSDYYFERLNRESAGTVPDNNCVFDIINYFSVTMIIFLKSYLLESDLNGCLRRLFKYPPIEDISLLTTKALNLKYHNINTIDSAKDSDNTVGLGLDEFVDVYEFDQAEGYSSSTSDESPKSVVIKLLDDSTVVETPNSSESETFTSNLTRQQLGTQLHHIATQLQRIQKRDSSGEEINNIRLQLLKIISDFNLTN